jgi:hypothetical protein
LFLFYRLICVVLFFVVMSWLAHLARDFGEWSGGFCGGLLIGGLGISLRSILSEPHHYHLRQRILHTLFFIGGFALTMYLFINSTSRGDWLTGFIVAAPFAAIVTAWAIAHERREKIALGMNLVGGRWRPGCEEARASLQ